MVYEGHKGHITEVNLRLGGLLFRKGCFQRNRGLASHAFFSLSAFPVRGRIALAHPGRDSPDPGAILLGVPC